ncbi:hypothetical protein B0T17DRAFT_490740 [Bombardia bombarda]|uniref:UBX domain-containing protein 2 n=1 Tax=Bombardia bombarda TaxID=252184 RepID=A0AA39X7C2_9PEZI|nr:hypothetical protein B0T17DRAFT_490740 [Bombardia bombarda]
MFFEGSLENGIATAVQQSKFVLCFVTDGEAESQQWEDEFLKADEIRSLIETETVALRLEAGSEEEGYFVQLFPVPKKPTVVIIRNGQLKEYLFAGATKEDFVRRVQTALQPTEPAPATSPSPAPSQSYPSAASLAPQPESTTQPAASSPSCSNPSPPSSSAHTQPGSSESAPAASSPNPGAPSPSNEAQIQALLTERAARLAAQKKKEEEDAKRRRIEQAQAKADVEAATGQKDPQTKHIEMVKKKQQEAREERQRILKAIEDDKAARRARQAEIAAERRTASTDEKTESSSSSAPFAPASQLLPSTGRLSEHCALQARLFDGSTIRSRFSSTENTLNDVRQWIDETRGDGKTPYTFKVLLSPLPSRTIDVTEENIPLHVLGLAPSATLILVPVQKYSAAYSGGGRGELANIFSRFIAYLLALVSGFFGGLYGFFATLFSTQGPPPATPAARDSTAGEAQRGSRAPGPAAAAARNRIKGLNPSASAERKPDQQFYNGNSTNFEPRRDDEDKQ